MNKMNKKIMIILVLFVTSIMSFAQDNKGGAIMTLEKTTYDLGDFSEDNPVVTCEIVFTNTGDAPLVIFQTVTSCGCTVTEFDKEPVMPNKKGKIKITYNGAGKLPGKFKKSITIRTNSKPELLRVFITGNMEGTIKK